MSLASHVTVQVHIDPRTPFAKRLIPEEELKSSFTSHVPSNISAVAPVVSWTLITRLSLRDPENLRTFLFAVGEDVSLANRIDMDLFLLSKRTRGGHDIALDTRRGVNELMLRDGDHLDWKLDTIAVRMKQQSIQARERESLESRSIADDDDDERPENRRTRAAALKGGRSAISASGRDDRRRQSNLIGGGCRPRASTVDEDSNTSSHIRKGNKGVDDEDDEDVRQQQQPQDDHEYEHDADDDRCAEQRNGTVGPSNDADYDYCDEDEGNDDEQRFDTSGASARTQGVTDVMRASRASRLKLLREFERSQSRAQRGGGGRLHDGGDQHHDALLPEFDELGNPIVALPNVEDYLLELENEEMEVELHEIAAEMELVMQEEQQQRQLVEGSRRGVGITNDAQREGRSVSHGGGGQQQQFFLSSVPPLVPLRTQQRLDAIVCQICRKMTLRAALAAERELEDHIRAEFQKRIDQRRQQQDSLQLLQQHRFEPPTTRMDDASAEPSDGGWELALRRRNDAASFGLQGRIVVTSLGEALQRAYLPSVMDLL